MYTHSPPERTRNPTFLSHTCFRTLSDDWNQQTISDWQTVPWYDVLFQTKPHQKEKRRLAYNWRDSEKMLATVCVCVCVSLECVTVLSSVQAITQPDGDAGFTLSMTVSSMQQRMRCAKQMDNICSVILKTCIWIFFSLYLFLTRILFTLNEERTFIFSGSPAPFVVIRFCFRWCSRSE